jgi:hypothetical protein
MNTAVDIVSRRAAPPMALRSGGRTAIEYLKWVERVWDISS